MAKAAKLCHFLATHYPELPVTRRRSPGAPRPHVPSTPRAVWVPPPVKALRAAQEALPMQPADPGPVRKGEQRSSRLRRSATQPTLHSAILKRWLQERKTVRQAAGL